MPGHDILGEPPLLFLGAEVRRVDREQTGDDTPTAAARAPGRHSHLACGVPPDPGNLIRSGKPPFLERGNHSVGAVSHGGDDEEVLSTQEDAVGGLSQACAIGLFGEILIEGVVGNDLTCGEGCSVVDTPLFTVATTSPLNPREGEEEVEGLFVAGMIECDRGVDGQLDPRRRLVILFERDE